MKRLTAAGGSTKEAFEGKRASVLAWVWIEPQVKEMQQASSSVVMKSDPDFPLHAHLMLPSFCYAPPFSQVSPFPPFVAAYGGYPSI